MTEDLDGAFADLERAEAAAQRHGLDDQLARIHFLRGNLYFPRGNIAGCLDQHQKSLELGRRIGSPELEAQALGGLADAEYARGRMLTAYRCFRDCVELCARHGFGRIEVANRPMAAITRNYSLDLDGALSEAREAIAATDRVGHQRAGIIARHAVALAGFARGNWDEVEVALEQALMLTRQLGARRFEAETLTFLGEVRSRAGRRSEAVALAREGLAISRATGMAYMGPILLGFLARFTDDLQERAAALAEGEALLANGSISHNYLWFYREAIEAALEMADYDAVERYAAALAAYTAPEPLPWADFVVAWGRALAASARGILDAGDPGRADAAARRGPQRRLAHRAARARGGARRPAPGHPIVAGGSAARPDYMSAMKILIIEDDAEAGEYLCKGLRESGHGAELVRDGRDGLLQAATGEWDVLIVDRMLPGLDGLSLVRHLRATGHSTPVLFLSALGEVDDRVKGLRAGGDDYLVKPYAFSELLARVENLGRRQTTAPVATRLRVADLELDLLTRKVSRAGKVIDLQPREFQLLETLLRHPGRVMTRTMLLETVWDYHFDPQTNVIDVHISRLRQKVDRGFEPPLIHTVRGAGYCLRAPETAA